MSTTVHNYKHLDFDPDRLEWVYVGRPSPWGNPFRMHSESERKDSVIRYAKHLCQRPRLVEEIKSQLKGKKLVCWCAPKLCHANVLALVADGHEPIHVYEALLRG